MNETASPASRPARQSPEHGLARVRAELARPGAGGRLLAVFLVCIGVFILWGIWRAAFPPRPPLQGQMEARTISVASKVPGRVARVLVREGDVVRKGQAVAELHLPEVEARLSQAQAQERAARARQSLVDEGARPQEKRAARAEWERARAAADLAAKTYRRISALFRDGLVSAQRYDEVRAEWIAADQQALAASSMTSPRPAAAARKRAPRRT